ncbi:MAG: hypothetical protein HRT61_13745 [Ekhidna sp.]|nr:hypothetical protein [Ekhidna sp.]
MTQTEQKLIIDYKDQLSEKLQIEGEWKQRNFIHLIELIEKESGIKISLSTIKRIWALNLTNLPHPSTLNALVSVLGYEDWLAFKAAQLNGVDGNANRSVRLNWFLLAFLGLASVISIYVIGNRESGAIPAIPVIKVDGTVLAVPAIPNTIESVDDVSTVSADSSSSKKQEVMPPRSE